MTDTVAVIIGTFGDREEWTPLVRRASASVAAQTRPPDMVIWEHADTLQHARNYGAAKAGHCDWFIFLDADDELEPSYVESMLAGSGDVRRPSTLGIYEDGTQDEAAVLIPERELRSANYIVIGAMCRSQMFFDVDGFDDWPVLEDWALWLKMLNAGARFIAAPDAIYKVHVRPGSRNSDEQLHGRVYTAIRARYLG